MGLPSLDFFSPSARHRLWRGNELGLADAQVVPTGHAALDAELPGGGWPVGAMTELLHAAPHLHAWQLLLPALARAVQAASGPVALIGAPFEPYAPALAACGLPAEALLWVRSDAAAARSWGCEQALRCADLAAVLAWLPQARPGELRRLQLAAAQHESLLFVFRPEAAAAQASPACLRLRLVTCADDPAQIDVELLKRRGPPRTQPVQLPARSQRMAALLAASQLRRKLRRQQEGAPEADAATHPGLAAPPRVRLDLGRPESAMDRAALAA